jgi:endonuclease YncB( thermonuclease family)
MDEAKRLGEYDSVGGSSTHVLFSFPGYGALYMGSIISISYSTYRDKTPVYNLGNTNIDGFAFGKRYVAGSIVKTLFMNDDLRQFLTKIKNDIGLKTSLDNLYALGNDNIKTYHNLLIDDLIPFDIIIVMCSEYGDWAISEVVYGATFINTGQVHSIADLITETTMSFIANDAKMTHDKIGSQITNLTNPNGEKSASSLTDTIDNKNSQTVMKLPDDYFEALDLVEAGELPIEVLFYYDSKTKKLKKDLNNVNTSTGNKDDGPTKVEISGNQNLSGVMSPTDVDPYALKAANSNLDRGHGIHDGDTIQFTVAKGNKMYNTSFRLQGIDTPEVAYGSVLTQPFGIEAKEFLEDYMRSGKWDADVDSGKVKTTGTDGKSRILLFNINYNIEVLKNGLAVYTDDFIRQLNLDEADREALNAAYRYGKDNKKGMWDGKNPVINPSDWRKMSKEAQKEAGGK